MPNNNPDVALTPDEREQYRNYARAMGWAEDRVLEASDERLMNLMHGMADECAKYGCD